MPKFTIGADPEVFLETIKRNHIVPSQGRVLGTKTEPWLMPGYYSTPYGGKFATQRDNVAAEFNIPAVDRETSFVNSIVNGRTMLLKSIPYAKRKNIQISRKSSALIDEKYLNNEEALNFGCEPDFNAWTISENKIDRSAIDPRFRTAGGHVHVGYHQFSKNMNPVALVRAMDLFLGVQSIFIDPDKERRTLYGKAGAYRPTDYGIEYRVLSNFWIHENKLIQWVFRQTEQAFNFAKREQIQPDSTLGVAIQKAINESDEDAANYVFSEVPVARYSFPVKLNFSGPIENSSVSTALNSDTTWHTTTVTFDV